jgi:hypothetical protein
MQNTSRRTARDRANATHAADAALREIKDLKIDPGPISFGSGPSEFQRQMVAHQGNRAASLRAIAKQPFHVMVEVTTETKLPNGEYSEKQQLWYGNENTRTNEVFEVNGSRIPVLAWTHPGLQVALAAPLGKIRDIRASGYRIASVEPTARARFSTVIPDIAGLYEPGGQVRLQTDTRASAAKPSGLKAVKLEMTADQVSAFVNRMSGLMVVTGAPGSGKTTVAFQRIRFLFDQQGERSPSANHIRFAPELTKVFVANPQLVTYTRNLLVDQLDVPAEVVAEAETFISAYLDNVWRYKHEARPRQRKLTRLEERARQAVFGLRSLRDLKRCWQKYETQISARLQEATEAQWLKGFRTSEDALAALERLAKAISRHGRSQTPQTIPRRSQLAMAPLLAAVSREYAAFRSELSSSRREVFDESFMHWLYWVYDPFDALAHYVSEERTKNALLMRNGTGERGFEEMVFGTIERDWKARLYGPEETPWLAFLLRFALPEEREPANRFREIPAALTGSGYGEELWTHIAIDEAQDLSAPEAALLTSFVDPQGAITLSADFRQIVLPVHGIVDDEGIDCFRFGSSLRDPRDHSLFPFARNMRQSKQIGRFLQSFYEAAFGERPTFEPSETINDTKPELRIAEWERYAEIIRQRINVLKRSPLVRSVAVVQINEDEEEMRRLRDRLTKVGLELAEVWSPIAVPDRLVTTSVERCKGMEYDACFVLGLEAVERASLNFAKNRAYVALSRPARRLVILCDQFAPILRRVDPALFEVWNV